MLCPPILHSKAPIYVFDIYLYCNIGTVSHTRTIWDDLGPGFEISVRWQKPRSKGWESTTFRVMIRLGPAS